MAERITFKFNQSAYRRMLGPGGEFNTSVKAVAEDLRNQVSAGAPVESGALAASVYVTPWHGRDATDVRFAVGSRLKYAGWQNSGTGPIHARPGGLLRFRPKGSSVFIFRKFTRGVPATHFLTKPLKALRATEFRGRYKSSPRPHSTR